jgi:uncharacterized protein YcbK (DUF882 family)
VLLFLAIAPSSTESAIANGDTRTLEFSNGHTNESGSFTYRVNGYYDSAVLEKLNWFMRDWRLNEPTKMDPKLFDIIWEVYRQSGSRQPIDVLSGYRSPSTNSLLRRRSSLVAEHSQHMQGKAIDAHFTDVSVATIRDIAMRMQAGGVGFYPQGTTWVHIDSGSVRYWPRMSRDAMTRLFPDGKTVFIPSDGQPMPGYDLARAEIESRGGEVLTASNTAPSLFAWLFGARGGGADDAEEGGEVASGRGGTRAARSTEVASAAPDPIASARANTPRGQTYMQAPPVQVASASSSDTVMSGRGVFSRLSQAPAWAPPPAAEVAARPRPTPAPAPTPAPEPVQVATTESDPPADSAPITLRGPIAAKFIAPLPPRKPADLSEAVAMAAPLPPVRPAAVDLAYSSDQPPAQPSNADLIAKLIEHGQLPGEITHGWKASPPRDALALVGPSSPRGHDNSEALSRAAALSAPLPPPRPIARAPAKDGETTLAPRSLPPLPPPRVAPGSASATPYGALVVDAFNATGDVQDPAARFLANGLRGSAQ